jgi:hypothetical protein
MGDYTLLLQICSEKVRYSRIKPVAHGCGSNGLPCRVHCQKNVGRSDNAIIVALDIYMRSLSIIVIKLSYSNGYLKSNVLALGTSRYLHL